MRITIKRSAEGPLSESGVPQKIVYAHLKSAITEASIFTERRVKARTPVGVFGDSGLRGSIFSEVSERLHGITAVISSPLPYAEGVELGTSPHMPPIKSLTRWVEVKFGLSGKAAESRAWAVAMSIKKKGTKGQYMFQRGLADGLSVIEDIFNDMGFDIETDLEGGKS